MKYQKHLLFQVVMFSDILGLPVKGMVAPRWLGSSVVKQCEVLSYGHGFLSHSSFSNTLFNLENNVQHSYHMTCLLHCTSRWQSLLAVP